MLIKKCKHLVQSVDNQTTKVLFCQKRKHCLMVKHLQQHHLQNRVTFSFKMVVFLLLLLPLKCVDSVGYSYTRFVGPVTGPERKIFVNDANSDNDGKPRIHGSDAQSFDYVGKPEYEFAYGVEDADAHILHNRNEMRDGDTVKGVYSLIDPDGTLRVVKYTADEINGFQAEVVRNGVSSLHGQLQHDSFHTPPSIYNSHHNPNYELHQYPQSQAHFKGDRIVNHPSSNTYKPNVAELPHSKHETLPQLPIIYHYNKNYGYDDDDDDDENKDVDADNNSRSHQNYSDYNKDQQPHYEVHEKPEEENQQNQDQQPQYKVHEKPDEETQENHDEDHRYKSNNHIKFSSHKKKKQHPDEDDDSDDEDKDDDDDDDDEDVDIEDSDEMGDYDETVHATHNSDESYEYY